jgi:dienelactone hydrolase
MATTSCCPDNSWGAPLDINHDTKSLDGARGALHFIGPAKDLEIYVSRPEEGNGIITSSQKALCVLTDVYGLQSRLYAICDKLATDLKCTVVALDTFRGETKDKHLEDFKEWLGCHPFERGDVESAIKTKDDKSAIYPVKDDIVSCFAFLSETYNIKSSDVGAVGFCWGVWAMTKACEMNLFHCGVGFHPSIKIESMVFGGDQEAIVKKAADNTPLLFCVAGNDLENLKDGGELAQIIIASSKSKHTSEDHKAAPRCVEFPEMMHGWVSRGDTSIDKVKGDAEASLKLAVDFLRHWM